MTLPSQNYLQSRIDYNPETGEARWKTVDESYGPGWRIFNSKYAGKQIKNEFRIRDSRYSLAKVIYKLIHNIDTNRISYVDGDCNNTRIDNISYLAAKKLPAISHPPIQKLMTIPESLHTLVRYDHVSGFIYWLPRDNNHFNATYAGKIAGSQNTNDYIRIKLDGHFYGAHRLAWKLYYNCDPDTYHIDHVNGIKSDNSIKNLRLANHSFNIQQSTKANPLFEASTQKYTITLSAYSSRIPLGLFDTEAQARQAYEAAMQKYKPIYKFTPTEQAQLDKLYQTYPNCDYNLQKCCHELQVKALNYYVDAAIVQTPKK